MLTAILVVILKGILVVVTFYFAASIGGAMRFAAPLLVPLHWLAARGSGPRECAWWAMLAGLSSAEAVWMVVLGGTDHAVLAATSGLATFFAMSLALLRTRAAAAAEAAARIRSQRPSRGEGDPYAPSGSTQDALPGLAN